MSRLSFAIVFLSAAARAGGIDVAGLDRSIAPGDDFSGYANGGWAKATQIPPDKSRYGIWTILDDEAKKRTEALIKEAAAKKGDADAQRVGDFYAAFMDEATIEKKGLTPLEPTLAAIAAVKDKKELARVLGSQVRADVDPLNDTNLHTENLFGLWVTQGFEDPAHNLPYLLQGGLALPDRDYYVSAEKRMVELRPKYQAHIARMLKLGGFDDAEARAARVLALETKLAQVHATRVESEDVHKANNPWKRDELQQRAPGLDWDTFLKAAGLEQQPLFIIWHPKATAGLSALTASEPLQAWKDWLAYHALLHAAPVLAKAFVDERFDFFRRTLRGVPEQQPRWQRGIDLTNDCLGEAVGKLYVKKYFPPQAKAQVQELVANLEKAFARRIDALAWMAPATRAHAKAKLATLAVGIGYPDKWRDYKGLEIARGDAYGNFARAELFDYRRNLTKLHSPVDKKEWWLSPQTVNALNVPLQNALDFPAAILVPPFFDPNAEAAQNYGAIGAVIGHEISHSFDDQGALFDEKGRLANWWTPEDLKHFQAAGEKLAAQYDAYQPFPDVHVNGHLTLGENIADVAGLSAAYDAWKMTRGKLSQADEQTFFLSFAQSLARNKWREPALRESLVTNSHAPDQYRGDTVRNLDAWYGAFSVTPKQKLYLAPQDRVRIW